MIEARALAFAMMAAERRPLLRLDGEVRRALGLSSRRRMRTDLLLERLAALVADYPTWRRRAQRAQVRFEQHWSAAA
jgi:hypothetical protein